MTKEHFTHGYGYVRIGDEPEVGDRNYNPDSRLNDLLYARLSYGYSWRGYVRPTMSLMYLRPSKLRYTKPNELLVVDAPEAPGFLLATGWPLEYYAPNNYDYPTTVWESSTDIKYVNSSMTSPTYSTTGSMPIPISSVCWLAGHQQGPPWSVNAPEGGPGLPTNYFQHAAITTVDIPGTSIGTLWKHPQGRTNWFNEVAVIPLSQGNIEIGGPFNPPDSLLQHMGYQVYYTKSGGSGRSGNATNSLLTAPVTGGNGVISSPSTFVDGDSQGLFVAGQASGFSPGSILVSSTATSGSLTTLTDSTAAWTTDQYRDKLVQIMGGTGSGQTRWIASNTGTSIRVSVPWATGPDATSVYRIINSGSHYIRINSGAAKGTYLVLSVIDANTLILDAPAINTPFSPASGLSWEMVTGPIGEYFFRKKSYQTYPSHGMSSQMGNGNWLALGNLQHEIFSLQNTSQASCVNVIYDRGACWWGLANNGAVPLIRWIHMSKQSFEPMHLAGKISGLSSWPYLNANTRDLAIDDQNKIWIVGDPVNGSSVRDGRVSTLRVDPYPGGDAHTPSLVASYSGDMTAPATVVNPLGANSYGAVVCDDSKAYAPNTRVWLIPTAVTNVDNGISYTDDYGVAWKRLHPLHTRTGTADVTGTSVTGTGTSFTTEFAVGDWIRFDDDRTLYIPMTGQAGNSYVPDVGSRNWPVSVVGGAIVSTTESKFGDGSLALNGTDSYLSIPWNSNLTFGTGDFTVECWVYLTETPNGEALITDQFTATGDEIAWALHFTTTTPGATTGSNLSFASYSGSSWTGVTSTSTPPLNTWTHIAACRSGSTLKLFMDGVEIASGSFTTNIPAGDALWVGRRWDTAGTRDFVSGYMNDLRVIRGQALYTAAFTPPGQFQAIGRSYEIQSIADDTTMTLVSGPTTNLTGKALMRGVFPSRDVATVAVENTIGYEGWTRGTQRSPADYDSSGNLFWVSSGSIRYVVRWKQSQGFVDTLAPSNLARQLVAYDNTAFLSLAVQRVPNPDGLDDHRLHDSIWVGSHYQGMSRIEKEFNGNSTRYHKSLSDNFPITGFMQSSPSNDNLHSPRAVVNPLTGANTIYGKYRYGFAIGGDSRNGEGANNFHYAVGMTSDNMGKFENLGAYFMFGRVNATDYTPYTSPSSLDGEVAVGGSWNALGAVLGASYDDVGLGMRAALCPTNQGSNPYNNYTNAGGSSNRYTGQNNWRCGALYGERWLSKRWNGTVWRYGAVNEYNASLDYEKILTPPGPRVAIPMNVGTGVKRMHPDWQPLDVDTGLRIRFVDTTPQLISQDQQFIVDETTTFLCYIGKGKDYSQTMYYGVDMFQTPTYTRFQEETPKQIKNMWTQDGGSEGGFTRISAATVNLMPPYARGLSIGSSTVPHGGTPYPDLSSNRSATGPYQHYGMSLRIKPEFELTGDGTIYGATPGQETKFTSTSYTFTAGDIGKSIIIEGASGVISDVDNGQAVIVSIDPSDAHTVVTDKTFISNKSFLRWKLMVIPAVSYVVVPFSNSDITNGMVKTNIKLYSSLDRGVTYQLVKKRDAIRSKTANTTLTDAQDSEIFDSVHIWERGEQGWQSGNHAYGNFQTFFDLRALPESQRRRQFWKVIVDNSAGDANESFRVQGPLLLDDQFVPLGVPPNCRLDDALDPEFRHAIVYRASINLFSGGGISPVDEGYGTGYTDTLSFGGSFYTQAGTNNASLSVSNFSSTAITFSKSDIGKSIRISGSATPANNGFAVITALVDQNTVTTDKAFAAETNTFSWAFLPFGSGDSLRVLDPLYRSAVLNGNNLSDSTMMIVDVPSASTIKLSEPLFPLSVTNKTFTIEQSAGTGDVYMGNYIGSTNPNPSYDVSKRWSYSHSRGTLAWSSLHEFVELDSSSTITVTANSDDDGDSRTDVVVVDSNLASSGAAIGDYLMLSNSTNGRRVYEISAIAFDTPTGKTTITVTYDEIIAGDTFTTWQVLRRKNLTVSYPRVLIATQ